MNFLLEYLLSLQTANKKFHEVPDIYHIRFHKPAPIIQSLNKGSYCGFA
jgi:hypothetical protein